MILTDAELNYYARQILLESWDIDAQFALKRAKAIIIGMGGLGCPVAQVLVRAGIGQVLLIDDDVVEISNLQRQTLFTPEHQGQGKAKVAHEVLSLINPHVSIYWSSQRVQVNLYKTDDHKQWAKPTKPTGNHKSLSKQLFRQIFNKQSIGTIAQQLARSNLADLWQAHWKSKPDLIIDCSDNFMTRHLINAYCVNTQIPLLSASAVGSTGQLTLFEPKRDLGCYACVFGMQTLGYVKALEELTVQPYADPIKPTSCAESGVLASTTAVVGSLQANAAMQYLGRGHNQLASKLLLWEGVTLTQRLIGYHKQVDCPICQNEPA